MRILVVVHGYPPSGTGGAELYAEALAIRLAAAGDRVVVLAREQDRATAQFRVREEQRGAIRICWINNTFAGATCFADSYYQPAIDAIAGRLIDQARPDIAHVHHLTGLSTTILDELGRRRIPVVLTLHDYWLMCHRGQLFDESMTACDGPGENGCARCTGVAGVPAAALGAGLLRLADRRAPAAARQLRRLAGLAPHQALLPGAAAEASRVRLAHMRDRFAHVTVALAPSRHVRERFVRAGFPAAAIRVSEYGVEPLPRCQPSAAAPLRLGYLGALMVSKAPHMLADALAAFPPSRVTASIFGAPAAYHGDTAYADTIAARLSRPGVTLHGAVPHDEVPRALAAMDVLVFPSVWEETSGIGAREAVSAGVPVIASRIGGIPETIRHGVNGLLFTPGDTAGLIAQVRRLLDEPQLLPALRRGCSTPRTLDDDVAHTRALYEQLRGSNGAAPGGLLPARARVAAVVLNYGTPEQTALAAELLLRSEAAADVVVVDNGDGRACEEALGRSAGRVTCCATGGNIGYSGGCNAGIGRALARGADYVWLVNSDVLVPPDCLGRLLAALGARPDVSVVAPVVRSRAWPARVLSAGLDYDVRTGRMRERTRPGPAPGIEPVSAVSGCAMLVRRAVFERIGLLPDEYFFSFEDVAFCQRARRAGFGVAVVTDAAVFHEGQGTMGAHPRRLYYAARNHLRLGAETPAASAAHRWARQLAIASFNLARAVTASDGALPARAGAVLLGIADHLRGRYGQR